MKLRGMRRVIGKNERGWDVFSDLPLSKEEAEAEGVAQYQPSPPPFCTICRMTHTIYTKTGIKHCCGDRNANNAWFLAKLNNEPLSPDMATAQGKDYYWRAPKGLYCGHIGKRTLKDECYICAEDKAAGKLVISPRQAALAAGEKWYSPVDGELCKAGHYARRRVINGSCEQCEIEAGKRSAERELPINKQYPEMIIKYEAARAMGFTVYRTGEPCRAGHTGWRYVSTRNCLACMGR